MVCGRDPHELTRVARLCGSICSCGSEPRENRQVGGGKVERGGVRRPYPFYGDVFAGHGRRAVGRKIADEGAERDAARAVIVDEFTEIGGDGELAAELFADFALERVGGGFSGLDFAARKLPLKREVFVWGALGHKNVAVGLTDDGADDGNGVGRGHAGS